jgi:hypothetical protein
MRCTLGAMSAIFVEYATVADRDKARVKVLGQNVDARTLTPGVAEAGAKAAPSGRTTGNYVEYAYSVTEQKRPRTASGTWGTTPGRRWPGTPSLTGPMTSARAGLRCGTSGPDTPERCPDKPEISRDVRELGVSTSVPYVPSAAES